MTTDPTRIEDKIPAASSHRRRFFGAAAVLGLAIAGAVMLLTRESPKLEPEVSEAPGTAAGITAGDALAFDFGVLSQGEAVSHVFVIPNPGSESLKLLRAESSCAALTVGPLPGEINPGGEGRIEVSYRASAPGITWAEVLIETDRVTHSPISLKWTGLVSNPWPKWEVPADAYISLEDLSRLESGGVRPVLLDVRPQAKFERLRLPEARHFPPHALKTLGFLRGKHVVVITEGHQDDVFLREIEQLRSRGGVASARILAGGLRAWNQAGRPVTGSASAMAEMMTIPAHQFDGWDGNQWMIVQASPPVPGTLHQRGRVPGAKHLTWQPDWQTAQWREAIAKLVAGRPGSTKLLFIAERGEDYNAIEEAVGSMNGADIFYLQDGTAGFEKWARLQTSMRDSKAVTLSGEGGWGGSSAIHGGGGSTSSAGCCPSKK